MVVLDTNIIIDHLRRKTKEDSYLVTLVKTDPKLDLAISAITVQELYEGKSTLDPYKEQVMLSIISPLKILSYTYDTAQLAGEIARNSKQPIELADAAIAATAILHSAELYTLNRSDFTDIDELTLY